jgi:uncharacterized protein
MRRSSFVVLNSDGIPLAGTVWVPPTPGPHPAVVLTGPLSTVRDQVATGYATRLADRGLVTLAFDHRNFGESAGMPRQHEDPQGKLCDLRAAVGWLLRHPAVAGDRIAVCGVSVGGGYALQAAASDPRVGAVVAVGGAFNSPLRTYRQLGPRRYRDLLARFLSAEYGPDGERAYLPVVDAGNGPAMIAGEQQYAYFTSERGRSPHWENRITTLSAYSLMTVDALAAADLVAPAPLLLVHGRRDDYCSPELAQEVYERAGGPRRLVWVDIDGHVDLYDQPQLLDRVADEIAGFLDEHLDGRGRYGGPPPEET